VKAYPLVDALLAPVLRGAMPRVPWLVLPSAIIHLVSRCKDREFALTTATDFVVLLAHLGETDRRYDVACSHTPGGVVPTMPSGRPIP